MLCDIARQTVVHARRVIRVPNAETWSKDDVAAVRITTRNLHEASKPEVVFKDAAPSAEDDAARKPHVARRVYIKPKDIEDYGQSLPQR